MVPEPQPKPRFTATTRRWWVLLPSLPAGWPAEKGAVIATVEGQRRRVGGRALGLFPALTRIQCPASPAPQDAPGTTLRPPPLRRDHSSPGKRLRLLLLLLLLLLLETECEPEACPGGGAVTLLRGVRQLKQ